MADLRSSVELFPGTGWRSRYRYKGRDESLATSLAITRYKISSSRIEREEMGWSWPGARINDNLWNEKGVMRFSVCHSPFYLLMEKLGKGCGDHDPSNRRSSRRAFSVPPSRTALFLASSPSSRPWSLVNALADVALIKTGKQVQ